MPTSRRVPQRPAVVVLRGVAADRAGAALREAFATLGVADVPSPDPPGPPRVAVLVELGAVVHVDAAVGRALVGLLGGLGNGQVSVLAAVPRRDRDVGWTLSELAGPRGWDDPQPTVAPGSRGSGQRDALPAGTALPPLADPLATVTPVSDETSVLHGRDISAVWAEADLRVVVGAAATDAGTGFAPVTDALAALARPGAGAHQADVVTDLLRLTPSHLAVLDATTTSHGPCGTALRTPLATGCLVVGRDALLVDVVGAQLFGMDPARSPTVAAGLAAGLLPQDCSLAGDTTPLPGLDVPPTALLDAARAVAASPGLARVVAAAMAPGPPSAHADGDGRDRVLGVLRATFAPWVRSAAQSPASVGTLAVLQGGLAAAAASLSAWQTTFAKDAVRQVEAPLGLDLGAYRAADYEAVETELRPLVDLVEALPATADGLRWAHFQGSVVFEVSRTVQASYEDWIARVDIAETIRLMADYVGGRRVVVSRDRRGRPVRQAERNLYLPQPNYLAFSGGQVIDVCKLEVVRHADDRCAIWWKTVASPNGSAEHDDGTVEFADAGAGTTAVTIRGRQKFTLPPIWQVVDLDRFPEIRDPLTEDAYRRFFTATLDNLEARFEGRPFAVGRPPDDELPSRRLSRLVDVAEGAAREWLAGKDLGGRAGHDRPAASGALRFASPRPQPDATDEHGFRHFRGPGGAG
jgi:hypothetical protein